MPAVITTVQCPACGNDVRVGLPNDATVKSVSLEPRADPDDPRRKVRENVCEADHRFHVYFVR